MNYVIQARKHPPYDLIAGLYTKLLARGRLWAEVFQFDAVAVNSWNKKTELKLPQHLTE